MEQVSADDPVKSPLPPGVKKTYYFGAGGLVYTYDENGLTLALRVAENGVLFEME